MKTLNLLVIHVLHSHMKKQILTIRDVDEVAWRQFRAKSAEKGLKTGDALTQAIRIWIEEKQESQKSPNPRLLLKVRPVKLGKNKKVRWSEEIDAVLYGSD